MSQGENLKWHLSLKKKKEKRKKKKKKKKQKEKGWGNLVKIWKDTKVEFWNARESWMESKRLKYEKADVYVHLDFFPQYYSFADIEI